MIRPVVNPLVRPLFFTRRREAGSRTCAPGTPMSRISPDALTWPVTILAIAASTLFPDGLIGVIRKGKSLFRPMESGVRKVAVPDGER